MGKFAMKGEESKKFEPVSIPANRYTAKIKELQNRVFEDKDKKKIDYVDVVFIIDNGEHAGKELVYACSKRLTDKTKLGELLAKAGTFVKADEDYDLEKILLGKAFHILTSNREWKNNEGKVINISFVTEVIEQFKDPYAS